MTVRTSIEVGVDELQRALADDAGFEAWYRRSVPRVYSYLMSRGGGRPFAFRSLVIRSITWPISASVLIGPAWRE